MEDSCSNVEMFPMLSPVMESELLREDWPQQRINFQNESPDPALWGENFQDLSDWCVDPKNTNRSHIPPPLQGQRDYHIGEKIKSENSDVKDNCDNLSYIKSESIENTGVGHRWTVDNNIGSTGMSLHRSLPKRQDQYNTVTDISDVWLDILPMTTGANEQQTIDNMTLISNRNENFTEQSFDVISKTIDTWLPDIPCNDLIIDKNQEDSIVDSCNSTSFNSNDDEYDNNQLLKDVLLIADVEPESFDLLSYVCDEGSNVLDRKNSVVEGISTSEIAGPSQANTNTTKVRRERKSSIQARIKAEPYAPPTKINLKSKDSSMIKKRRTSKQADQESGNCTESDSDTNTSDYSYKELREKNNKASRKSRINKKVKETEMQKRANDLERDNAVLKMKVEELEKLVTSMRTALLQSALKKKT